MLATDAATPFTRFAETWLARTRAHTEPSTIEAYTFVLTHYLAPYFGTEPIGAILRPRLKDWLAELSARRVLGGHPISRGTLRLACSVATLVFGDAEDSGVIPGNPAVRLGGRYRRRRGRQRHMPVYDDGERTRFLRVAALVAPECAPVYAVMALAGLRVGEARGLRPTDIRGPTIRVDRQLSRGGREKNPKFDSFGNVDLVDALDELLAPLVRRGRRYLFPGRYHDTALGYGILHTHMAAVAEVAELPRIPMKNLRHSYASVLVSAGESLEYVRRQMRHSSIEITVDLYGRWLPMAPSRLRLTRNACVCERTEAAVDRESHETDRRLGALRASDERLRPGRKESTDRRA